MKEKNELKVSFYTSESDSTTGYIGGVEVENVSWVDQFGREADISGFIDSLPKILCDKVWDYLESKGGENNVD